MYGNHLYLTLYSNNEYTYLEPIKRKKEFLKNLSIITNQKLKWKTESLHVEYYCTNYDELLENEDIRIKFIFYCIEFQIISFNFNYYTIIELLGCFTKNKIILKLYLEWLTKFRNSSLDFYRINFGRYKGDFYYNLPYDYLLFLINGKDKNSNKIIYNKKYNDELYKLREMYKIHLFQHPDECTKRFNEKDKYYIAHIAYFDKIKETYNASNLEEKIIITDKLHMHIKEFEKKFKSSENYKSLPYNNNKVKYIDKKQNNIHVTTSFID